MCVSPIRLPTNGVLVPCRICWQCRAARISDWVGRCIAEDETAAASSSITLTYGRDNEGNEDHFNAAVLVYRDVQKYFKLLRRRGFPLRYFAVGEVGSLKGRSHWHILIFWQKDMPTYEQGESLYGEVMKDGESYPVGKSFEERHWPHGRSHWNGFEEREIRYACKYLCKDLDDAAAQGHLAMSRFPPLGAKYFERLAARYVANGLAPQSGEYSFSNVLKPKGSGRGEPIKFYLQRQSLDLFLRSFLDQWAERRGGHPPVSPFLEAWCDSRAAGAIDPGWVPDRVSGRLRLPLAAPWISPPGGGEVSFSESHNTYVAGSSGERLFWSFDNEGRRAWRSVIIPEAEADRLRLAAELENRRKKSSSLYRVSRDGLPMS